MRMMKLIFLWLITLLSLEEVSLSQISGAPTIGLAPAAVPPPPVGTRCQGVSLLLNDTNLLTSTKLETFDVQKHSISIVPKEACGIMNENETSVICTETDWKKPTIESCSILHHSVLLCPKWWKNNGEILLPMDIGMLPEPTPEFDIEIEALCIILPTKPWCNPDVVCHWYPTLAMCTKRRNDDKMGVESNQTYQNFDVYWYVAGILKTFSLQCIRQPASTSSYVRLIQRNSPVMNL